MPRRPRQPGERRDKRLRDLAVLQDIYSVLAEGPGLDRILRQVAPRVARALGADVCAFLLHDPASGELVTQPGAQGLPGTGEPLLYRVRLDDPLTSSGRVFLSGKPLLCADAQRDKRVNPRYAKLWGYRALVVAPLVAGGRCIGVLRAGHKRAGVFGRDHVRLAMMVAGHAAVVVENARLHDRAERHVQELKRMNDAKTEFLSMVSHELLSPLSSVGGFLSLLRRGEAGPVAPKQEEFLALCERSVERVTRLIDDLLDVSRIEAGVVKIQKETVDLPALLAAATRDHAPQADAKGVRLEAAPGDVPPAVADPYRLRQVVDNLVSNALKFTPEGGKVLLSCRRTAEGAEVSVKDTGIGLSESERERVFERFYQVEPAGGPRRRGAGLGLAICKSLVALHGGRIWVESVPGKGADFRFTVPLPSVEPRAGIS